MEFRLLGALEAREGDRALPLGGAKQRALLAILLLNANEVVSRDRLIDQIWGENPPETAVPSLQVYVSRLRKFLPTGTLVTQPPGYVLRADPDQLDVYRAELGLAAGRKALAERDPARASSLLTGALALWHGAPLAEFAYAPFAQPEIARLEELRLALLEERIEADLSLGRHSELVGELEAVVAQNPFRERMRAQLMLSLYRSGRQAEALEAYQNARRALVEDLGIDPSQALQELERAILRQDESLEAPVFERLPGGTVTLLFTDIETSTRLLERLGDRYAEVLEQHRRLLRAAFTGQGGSEVETQGDSFFFAFRQATAAVAGAAAAQHALAAHSWPEHAEVRVRMGVHTGEPTAAGRGYIGLDVHRCARICAAAHGGQILVSQATRDLLADRLTLRDLGEYRLRDLTRPERLYQLLVPGLENDFPALRTVVETPLPAQPTPFIGREREVEEVARLLRRDDVRLVTLTGPGGIGKTRLAIHVAAELLEELAGAVVFVDLTSVTASELVASTIAQTLGAGETGDPVLETLKRSLADRSLLVVVDSFEQVVEAAPLLAELLVASRGLKLLVTSRFSLRLAAEHEYSVPPLSVPDQRRLPDLDSLLRYEAVALFVARVRTAKSDFRVTSENAPALAEICVRLDGLPLALELAATRVKLLPPKAMLRRLEQRLELLTGGPRDRPARQRTLRGTIDWSYELLDQSEQTLFGRLAIFAGGCSLEAAEGVCEADLDVLSSLADKSLLRHEERPDGEPRFLMLDTIREYALDRLEQSGELEEVARRHARHFLALAEQAEPEILRARQAEWLERLEADHDNFRSALSWSLEHSENELALRMIGALRRAWAARGFLAETRRWLEAALAKSNGAAPTFRAKAIYGLGRVALVQGDYDQAVPALEQCGTLFGELGDVPGLAYSLADLAWIRTEQGDHNRATALAEQGLALARSSGDKTIVSATLHSLACAVLDEGDHLRARALFEESVTLRRELGDKRNLANSLAYLGVTALLEYDHQRAKKLLEESLVLGRELGNVLVVAAALANLALVALFENEAARAASLSAESLELCGDLGEKRTMVECLYVLAAAASLAGETVRSATLAAGADALHASIGTPPSPVERATATRFIAPACAGLDDRLLAAAEAAGRAMKLEELVSYALAGR